MGRLCHTALQCLQPLESLYIVFFSLAAQKRKGDTEGAPSCINADYTEEQYAVFIRLIYTIEEENFRVYSKVDKRVGVRKENGYYMPI